MLTKVLYESELTTFKFWFAENIQDGTHYQNELFCRLATYPLADRALVYQLSYRLSQRSSGVLLSIAPTGCSLWGALRDPMTHAVLGGSTTLALNVTPVWTFTPASPVLSPVV